MTEEKQQKIWALESRIKSLEQECATLREDNANLNLALRKITPKEYLEQMGLSKIISHEQLQLLLDDGIDVAINHDLEYVRMNFRKYITKTDARNA